MTQSARGLFRATGKKSRPVAQRDLDGSIARADALDREPDDFYPTPPEPTRALLAAERDRLADFDLIWEPAAGNGAMVREMQRAGHAVFASDLVDRGCGADVRSFYAFDTAPARAMLTNPPFQECNWRDGKGRWILHALDTLGLEYMALLMNWSWPGAAGLSVVWRRFPPARVYLMRWKIDFTGQGAPPMLNGWFVWDRAAMGETVLRMLDRADPAQVELFAEAAE